MLLRKATWFQIIVTAVPETSPEITPCFVVLFQKSERRSGGPNDAPRPPQAKSTSQKTYSLARAPKMSAAATRIKTTMRLRKTSLFWLRDFPLAIIFWYMSRTTPEDATRSWESAVDMMAARIDAVMMPRSRGWRWDLARKGNKFSGSAPGRASGVR